jgi:hypothetical protein
VEVLWKRQKEGGGEREVFEREIRQIIEAEKEESKKQQQRVVKEEEEEDEEERRREFA